MGGVITDRDALLLQTPEAIKARFNIDVLVNTRAEEIDRTAHTVTDLATGAARRLHYDRLVLAPGATPVRPSIPGIEWALTLRNVEDADALAAAAQQARTDAVTGGGFIGLEVAENLVRKGLQVALVEATDQVLAPLDPEMATPARRAALGRGRPAPGVRGHRHR